MDRCPYCRRRLALSDDHKCDACGEDLSLYAALRDLPVTFYNEARLLWDAAELDEAVMLLHAALSLQPDRAEAHWLLGAIKIRQGELARARYHLIRARELGAEVDPDWATAQISGDSEQPVGPAIILLSTAETTPGEIRKRKKRTP